MPHIHDLIDFTVVAYIIYKNKVLMVKHKKINAWLPVGGHIELHEDPEEALLREIKEECGVDVKIIASKPNIKDTEVKSIYRPQYVNIHKVNGIHKHFVFIYFAKALSNKVKLAENEHSDIRWFSIQDLNNQKYGVWSDIKFYALKA